MRRSLAGISAAVTSTGSGDASPADMLTTMVDPLSWICWLKLATVVVVSDTRSPTLTMWPG